MQKNTQHILLVDDDAGHRGMLKMMLGSWGYKVTEAENGQKALDFISASTNSTTNAMPNIVLMDIRMAQMDGITALKHIKNSLPELPVIMMTAYSSLSTAVEALRLGAYDYLNKPLNFDELKLSLERASEHTLLKKENKKLKESLQILDDEEDLLFPELIGNSKVMRTLKQFILTVAPTEATILIEGESGTGKELVAKAIHSAGLRSKKELILLNCAALSENLLESELFGHEKGAFTGADKKREGRFIQANESTIFLDEIGEMPLSLQPKLLRVLQQGEIQRVGSDQLLKVDARIIAATNRNLLNEVKEGKFREDLYFRLNVINLKVPALRERKEDIPLLASYFLKKFSEKNNKNVTTINPKALELLSSYHWAGNVRELQNIIERAVILTPPNSNELDIKVLPPQFYNENKETNTLKISETLSNFNSETQGSLTDLSLATIEKQAIRENLKKYDGNRSEVARILGITRSTLLKKIKDYNLTENE
ncbi:sigma-54-dependent transcriptional regulator [Desulfovibrio litoralis]|uniref:Two-component system, NtrC family, response regulator HydG n=1 Tax=Desulfovibrio litoralis DSM 11393 TaxID=1121455 RepID=A0A1M7T644_9BACT|nr:sigma-54 dependent transcriptional regulator [Desulfovibrio litoralis]SHN66167.1 two-component system, NtrC family, response regulator HydG [Desulfovibrio litoralis DSM 11393]